jgi:hypothetical protein
MEGICKYKVEFVIVSTNKKYSYWLPPEKECLEVLARAYPRAFQLVHEEPGLEIFRVIPDFA